jgi:Tol biopolymer transport system component
MKQIRLRKFTFLLVLTIMAMPIAPAWAADQSPEDAQQGYQGSFSGGIVYTAETEDTNGDAVVDSSDNDIMFSNTIGANPVDGRFAIIGGQENSAAYPRLSQDGEIILCHAFVDTNGDGLVSEESDMPLLGVLNLDGSDLNPLTPPGQVGAFDAMWSPDQSKIAFSLVDGDTNGDGRITVTDVAKLALMEVGAIDPAAPTASQVAAANDFRILTDNQVSVSKPQFWANNLIVFAGTRAVDNLRQVYIYNLDTGVMEPFTPPEGEAFNPIPSPDESRLAVEVKVGEDQFVSVYDGAVDRWTRASPEGAIASDPNWSADGALVMSVRTATGSQVVIYENRQQRTFLESTEQISMTRFSPDGSAIAYAAVPAEGGNSVVKMMTMDGGYAASLTSTDSNVTDVVWIPEAPPPSETPSESGAFLPLPNVALLPSSVAVKPNWMAV